MDIEDWRIRHIRFYAHLSSVPSSGIMLIPKGGGVFDPKIDDLFLNGLQEWKKSLTFFFGLQEWNERQSKIFDF